MKRRLIATVLVVAGFLASQFDPPMAFLGMLSDLITKNRFTGPIATSYADDSAIWVGLWLGFDWYFSLAPYAFISGFIGAKLLPDRLSRLSMFPWIGLTLGFASVIPLAYIWYSTLPWNTKLTWQTLGKCCEVAACLIGINLGRFGFPRFTTCDLLTLTASAALVFAASSTGDGRLLVLSCLMFFCLLAFCSSPRETRARVTIDCTGDLELPVGEAEPWARSP